MQTNNHRLYSPTIRDSICIVEYHNYSKHVVEKHGFISYVQGITNQGRDGCIRIKYSCVTVTIFAEIFCKTM